MAQMQLMSFNGVTFDTSSYLVRFGYGKRAPTPHVSNLRQRAHRAPAFMSYAVQPRQQHFEVHPAPGYAGSLADLDLTLHSLFNGGGLRPLVARRDPADATTAMTVQALVLAFNRVEDNSWEGSFEFPDGYWQSSDASHTGSTNGGGEEALPVVAIASGASATRYRVTVTDNTGRGLAGYPLPITIAGLTPAHVRVYQRGRSVPFWYDSGTSKLWVRVDVQPGVPLALDVYSSTALANTVTAQAAQLGQLDPAASTSTSYVFTSLKATDAVAGSMVWQAGVTHVVRKGTTYSFGIVSEADTSLVIGMGANLKAYSPTMVDPGDATKWQAIDVPDPGLPDDADSIVCVAGVAVSSITGITTTLARTDYYLKASNTIAQTAYQTDLAAVTRYRLAGQSAWQLSASGTFPANAVEVAVGADPSGSQPGYRATLTTSGTFTLALDPGEVPTVAVSAPIAAYVVNGQLRNDTNGTSLTLVNLLMDAAATYTLDVGAVQQGTSTGPWYQDDPSYADPLRWFTLAPGANAVTNTLGATYTYALRYGI